MTFLESFWGDQGGAVTVDWVILTGCLVTMGMLVAGTVREGATDLSTGVGVTLTNAEVASLDLE